MKSIFEKIKQWKEDASKRRKEAIIETSKELYQITEYNHQLWFTYRNALFAPCKVMGAETAEQAVIIINTLRDFYVERTIKGIPTC